MDNETRQAIALWRLSCLGPLISARLGHGDRRTLFEQAAARHHQLPDGRLIRLSARTIEAWFYAYQEGGFAALYGACFLSSIRGDERQPKRQWQVHWTLRRRGNR